MARAQSTGSCMKRRLFSAIALGCLFVSFAAPVAESDPSRSAPMQFVLRQDAVPCGAKCKTWVSATGMIRAETARDFEEFARRNQIRGGIIALNSEGGSVHGAIALGRAIRKLGMTTTVGRTVDLPGYTDTGGKAIPANLLAKADCESMCAFVLLAGTQRVVPSDARVRVHQIWLGDRRDDAAAATYSAEDLVLVQRDIGKLAQYTVEMGGSVELLEISLRIPPWEPMRSLSRDELRRMNIDTSNVTDARSLPGETSAATPSPAAGGPLKRIALTPSQANDRVRGWAMVERSGSSTLTRRHPLTIEGEKLGTLDITFACGSSAGDVMVLYTETRRAGAEAPSSPLKSVELRMSGKTVPMVLGVSRDSQTSGERMSAASAVVPASVLRSFASNSARSITVETTSEADEAYVIRIGNTGAAQNATQFLTACAKTDRSEHAGLQPAAQ